MQLSRLLISILGGIFLDLRGGNLIFAPVLVQFCKFMKPFMKSFSFHFARSRRGYVTQVVLRGCVRSVRVVLVGGARSELMALVGCVCSLLVVLTGASCSGVERRPVVGITCSHVPNRSTVSMNYSESVVRLGGTPLLIPVTADSATLADLVSLVDGIILSGGGDVDPAYYGEDPIEELGDVDSLRDVCEMLLVRLALRRGLPILGICRGEQLLNVALGGSLWQDIPSQTGDTTVRHNQAEPSSVPTHLVYVEPGSELHRAVGRTQLMTNSHHHQAVRRVAPGLRVTARTADGIPEAVESTEGLPIWGVQFHPEALTMAGDTVAQGIIAAFLRHLK